MPRQCRCVHLSDPYAKPWPKPFPRCDICGALADQREVADAIGDKSKVIDCNIEIRRHPHPEAMCA